MDAIKEIFQNSDKPFLENTLGEWLFENGRITLDTTKYGMTIINNKIVLTRKITTLDSINDLKNNDFINSEIISCFINNKNMINEFESDTFNYSMILKYIYVNIIRNGKNIIQDGTLDYWTLPRNDKGFKKNYMKEIGISFRNVNANKYMYEIYHMCILNTISIQIEILNDEGNIIFICI